MSFASASSSSAFLPATKASWPATISRATQQRRHRRHTPGEHIESRDNIAFWAIRLRSMHHVGGTASRQHADFALAGLALGSVRCAGAQRQHHVAVAGYSFAFSIQRRSLGILSSIQRHPTPGSPADLPVHYAEYRGSRPIGGDDGGSSPQQHVATLDVDRAGQAVADSTLRVFGRRPVVQRFDRHGHRPARLAILRHFAGGSAAHGAYAGC